MRYYSTGLLFGLLAAMISITIQSARGQEATPAEAANKTLLQFWTKLQADDQKGLLAMVEVPFCFGDSNPDKIVEDFITDRKDLVKLMKEILEGTKGKKAQLNIVKTLTYQEFLKETGDILKKDGRLKKDRQALDETLKKGGHVIMARVTEGKSTFPVGFLVASPKGEQRVVGMLIGLTKPKKK